MLQSNDIEVEWLGNKAWNRDTIHIGGNELNRIGALYPPPPRNFTTLISLIPMKASVPDFVHSLESSGGFHT